MKNYTCALAILLVVFSSYSPLAFSRDFRLSDFSGDWIFHSTSSGGVGLNTGPGIASAVLRKISFDKNGVGEQNNGTFTFYNPDGTMKVYQGVKGQTIELSLTDSANGAGIIKVIDPNSFKATSTYNFIATRNRSGLVTKLNTIMTSTTSPLSSIVVTGEATRQVSN
jgi:hypothetical protein